MARRSALLLSSTLRLSLSVSEFDSFLAPRILKVGKAMRKGPSSLRVDVGVTLMVVSGTDFVVVCIVVVVGYVGLIFSFSSFPELCWGGMYFLGGFLVLEGAVLAEDVGRCVARVVGLRKLQNSGEKILYSLGREKRPPLGAGIAEKDMN